MRRNRKANVNLIKNNKSLLVVIAVGVILAALIITVNERYFGYESIPGWNDIYTMAGLDAAKSVDAEGNVAVHFIDVGQGDSQLIVTPNYTVLIDTGEREYSDIVINYLNHQNIEKLDYIIITHPHSDHAGGFGEIADKFPPEKLIMPDIKDDVIPTTATYMRILERIEKHSIEVIYPKSGMQIEFDDAKMQILGPVKDYDDLNNYSVVFKLLHGNNSFLFTGDMEKESENDIFDSRADLSAEVLKVAHHGSNSSSQKKFLNAVGGKYAVIGVGSPNSYGHPTEKVLGRLADLDYAIYRTDLNGNIVFISDGEDYEIITEKSEGKIAA